MRGGFFALALLATCGLAQAAQRLTIWDLPLGTSAADLPNGYVHFACGSDGGPPLKELSGWRDYALCAKEADGVHEVSFEYDDSPEQAALRTGRWLPLDQTGTLESYFPVIASALFNGNGRLVGVRLVTDARPDQRPDNGLPRPRPRREHYLLALYLIERFGLDPADCHDLPAGRGETPVIGQFVKRECLRDDPVTHRRYLISSRYFHKPGQHDVDPMTGLLTEGQFESVTRAEVRLLD